MIIHSVSKVEKEAVICLSSGELVQICNALHGVDDKHRNKQFFLLYAGLQNARDLSTYGHLDNFSLEYALNCRKQADKVEEQYENPCDN